jgi:uncharacterized membrane protein
VKLYCWYGAILSFTALALLLSYLVPSDSPFVVLSYIFGFIFVAFLPGYCLVSGLFASKENKLDRVEEIVLSAAMSFGIVGLAGLFLGLSPIGIGYNSIRVSLMAIVTVLATVAYIRKRQVMRASSAEP